MSDDKPDKKRRPTPRARARAHLARMLSMTAVAATPIFADGCDPVPSPGPGDTGLDSSGTDDGTTGDSGSTSGSDSGSSSSSGQSISDFFQKSRRRA